MYGFSSGIICWRKTWNTSAFEHGMESQQLSTWLPELSGGFWLLVPLTHWPVGSSGSECVNQSSKSPFITVFVFYWFCFPEKPQCIMKLENEVANGKWIIMICPFGCHPEKLQISNYPYPTWKLYSLISPEILKKVCVIQQCTISRKKKRFALKGW